MTVVVTSAIVNLPIWSVRRQSRNVPSIDDARKSFVVVQTTKTIFNILVAVPILDLRISLFIELYI